MLTKRMQGAIIVTMIVGSIFLATPPTSYAQSTTERKTQAETATTTARAEVTKKICAAHEAQVNSVMTRVVNRNQLRIDRITTVADKTKAFYESKDYQLASYAQLAADVDARRVIAQSAVSTIKSTASFSCESVAPRTIIQAFRSKHASGVEEVKAYRDAVKKLIVGVKSASKESTR